MVNSGRLHLWAEWSITNDLIFVHFEADLEMLLISVEYLSHVVDRNASCDDEFGILYRKLF